MSGHCSFSPSFGQNRVMTAAYRKRVVGRVTQSPSDTIP